MGKASHSRLQAACKVFLWLSGGISLAALAAGTGSPPPDAGEYTPARFGQASFVSPFASNYFSLAGDSQGCGWMPTYGDTATQNLAYPEANATYWQASPPFYNAAGTQIRIDGQFASSRFFSISLYNGSYSLISSLSDYQLLPHSGAKPFLSETQPDPSVSPAQSYTAYIVFGAAPAQPAANTLYVPPQISNITGLPSLQQLYLLYRVYVPRGATASGDVPLPVLSINGQPFSAFTQSAACQALSSQMLQNALYSVPLTPGQASYTAPKNPIFTVYQSSSIPGLSAGLNAANQYMSAQPSLPAGYIYIIRGKAPTYTSSAQLAPGAVPNVRYWSICQNTSVSTEVVACVGDFQARVDANGYYHIVVSNQAAAPAYADANHGFNWMPFGPQAPATVIYRQLLARPDFNGAIGSAAIGEYAPEITYCTLASFESFAASSHSAEQIFQECAATIN